MKKNILPMLRKMMLFMMGIIFLMPSNAQTVDGTPDVPQMWVSKTKSISRARRFKEGAFSLGGAKKGKILSTAINSIHPLSYTFSVQTFDDIISLVEKENQKQVTGIRVYFSAFNPNYQLPDFPMGATRPNEIVLLFVASTGLNSPDVGQYYVIGPVDGKLHALPDGIVGNWARNYVDKENNSPGGLVTTLEGGQDENIVPNGNPAPLYSDSRSIYYKIGNFVQFIRDERNYQDNDPVINPKKVKIDSIEIDFASYPNSGIGRNPDPTIKPSQFKNRFIILYEFKRNGKVFYIDKVPGFRQRNNPNRFVENGKVNIMGGDNGQLCPPNCPCPTPPCR